MTDIKDSGVSFRNLTSEVSGYKVFHVHKKPLRQAKLYRMYALHDCVDVRGTEGRNVRLINKLGNSPILRSFHPYSLHDCYMVQCDVWQYWMCLCVILLGVHNRFIVIYLISRLLSGNNQYCNRVQYVY